MVQLTERKQFTQAWLSTGRNNSICIIISENWRTPWRLLCGEDGRTAESAAGLRQPRRPRAGPDILFI